ncbi:hypothetical protein BDV11DRAFT_37929 [Aspergillus similis]
MGKQYFLSQPNGELLLFSMDSNILKPTLYNGASGLNSYSMFDCASAYTQFFPPAMAKLNLASSSGIIFFFRLGLPAQAASTRNWTSQERSSRSIRKAASSTSSPGDQALVQQERSLGLAPQHPCDLLPSLLRRHNAAILIILGDGVVQIAYILRDHVQRLSERGPGSAGYGMGVADGMNVSRGFVHSRVDMEDRGV